MVLPSASASLRPTRIHHAACVLGLHLARTGSHGLIPARTRYSCFLWSLHLHSAVLLRLKRSFFLVPTKSRLYKLPRVDNSESQIQSASTVAHAM